MASTSITKYSYIDLDVPEEFLSFVKIFVVAKPVESDTLSTVAEDCPSDGSTNKPEVHFSDIYWTFKKISKDTARDKFRLYYYFECYVSTTSLYASSQFALSGNPVDLFVAVYYMNNKGNHELQKFKI